MVFCFTDNERSILHIEIKRATDKEKDALIQAIESVIDDYFWLNDQDNNLRSTEIKRRMEEIGKATDELFQMLIKLPPSIRPGFVTKTLKMELRQLSWRAERTAEGIHPRTNSKPGKAQLKADLRNSWEWAMGKRPGKGKGTAYWNFEQVVLSTLSERGIRF